MNCKVTYENECGYWNWHCVPCDKKGPGFTDPIIAYGEGVAHGIGELYRPYVNPLEGLVP